MFLEKINKTKYLKKKILNPNNLLSGQIDKDLNVGDKKTKPTINNKYFFFNISKIFQLKLSKIQMVKLIKYANVLF